jgi:hypothetical protein
LSFCRWHIPFALPCLIRGIFCVQNDSQQAQAALAALSFLQQQQFPLLAGGVSAPVGTLGAPSSAGDDHAVAGAKFSVGMESGSSDGDDDEPADDPKVRFRAARRKPHWIWK